MKIGVIDLETTDLDAELGGIVELGLVIIDKPNVVDPGVMSFMYNAFNDPGVPISEEAGKVNGITDDMVKGRKLHVDLLKEELDGADMLIAHNAPFDYTFCSADEQTAWMCDLPWVCSLRHINWAEHGFTNALNLIYLSALHGFVNPFAHRALPDALSTWRLAEPHIDEMIDGAKEEIVQLKVFNTHFTQKDTLKAISQFRWVPEDTTERKHWFIELPVSEAERVYKELRSQIYGNAKKTEQNVQVKKVDWKTYLDEYKTVKY